MPLRNPWVIVGIMMIIAIAAIAIIGNVDDSGDHRGPPASDVFGEEIARLCEEAPDMDVTDDSPPDLPYPRRITLVYKGRLSPFLDGLPDDWRANNRDGLDLLFCMDTERIIVQECEYEADTGDDDLATVRRTQDVATVYAFTADGTLFENFTIDGVKPGRCPDSVTFYSDNRMRIVHGPLIYENFEEALYLYVTGEDPDAEATEADDE